MIILKIIGITIAVAILLACAVGLYVLVGFALYFRDDKKEDEQ